jgi:hypothetical protein
MTAFAMCVSRGANGVTRRQPRLSGNRVLMWRKVPLSICGCAGVLLFQVNFGFFFTDCHCSKTTSVLMDPPGTYLVATPPWAFRLGTR